MDFAVGDDAPLVSLEEHHTAITKMESSAENLHKSLKHILDYQTHHRLREAQGMFIKEIYELQKSLFHLIHFVFFIKGRKRAEDINERVLWWSIIETFGVLSISICQVMVLRNFFTDRTPSTGRYASL